MNKSGYSFLIILMHKRGKNEIARKFAFILNKSDVEWVVEIFTSSVKLPVDRKPPRLKDEGFPSCICCDAKGSRI